MPCRKALTGRERSYFDLNENDYHLIAKLVAFVTISFEMIIILITGGGGLKKKSITLYTAPSLTHRKNPLLEGINMLTAQKRKFAVALMSGMSQKDAAVKAGYSEKSARSKGSQLAKDPEVTAFITRKKKETVTVDEVPAYRKNVYTPAVNTPEKIPQPEVPPAAGQYDDPLKFLMAVMNDSTEDIDTRKDAAKAMLPYVHPKKGETGKKEARNAAAKVAAGASKFGSMAPPKLVVNNKEG